METKTILQPSWKNSLFPILFPKSNQPNSELPRVAIVGIGNEFNGDDAAGVLVARRLGTQESCVDAGHVLIIEAGQAPENITADLRRFQPQVVLMVDAAQLDADPGQVSWIPWETTTGMSASSHSLPLSMLARYLTLEFSCSVHLLGIQPVQNESYSSVSPLVQAAVDDICQTLCDSIFSN
ncbi:MAG: hydrogenase maturation protease [Chloroflexi bacterium]|nr:hydrogenase maturation protease [Chloroflexota bacterium]